MTVTDGPSPGSYRVELRQTVNDKVAWKAWDPASNPTVQESWTSNSFVLTQTDGNYTYKLSGAISGSDISGNYADNYKDTLMIGCQFSASRSDSGMSGAGPASSSGGGSSSPTNAGAAGGAFTGTIVGTDANITAGNIRFTVNGSAVQGTVRGKWTLGGSWGSYSYPVNGDYSGSFSGAYDPQTGKFDVPFSGAMAVYPPPTASDPNPTNTTDYSFSGTLHGSIQGGQAQGTWSANYKWGSWTAKWSASGPPPKSAEAVTGGSWVHTGSGNDADDYTWVPNSQPPGISGVGKVPGPADSEETGTGLLLPGLLTMAGIGLKSLLDSSVTPPPLVDDGSSAPDDGSADGSDGFTDSTTDSPVDSTSATGATDPSSAPAPQAPPAPSPYGADYDQAVKDSLSATNDYNNMLQQYADFQNGADKTDPQYQVLDRQYKDYLDYLKNKADSSSAGADSIAAAAVKQQNTQVLKDHWGNDKEVVYDPATGQWHDAQTGNLFDPDKWQESQKQIADDSASGQADLQKMAAHQDSFSKNLDQMVRDEKSKEAALNYLGKLQEMSYNTNLTDPGGAHDVFMTTQKMMNDILDGKPVSVPKILETRQFLHDSLLGTAASESILSLPENQANLGDITKAAAWGSLHELVTGRDADGHFTAAGVIGSIGLHVAGTIVAGPEYEWVSEGLLTAANTVYAEKDAIDHGASSWGALGAGALEAISQGGLQATGGLAMHYVPIHFPNVAAGIGEMVQPIKNALFLTEGQQITRNAVEKALASDNPADLIALYKNGRIAKLGELQAAGGLSASEAQALNSRLAPLVNSEIDKSTQLAIKQFQSRTGVKIEQSIIADSGSGARGGPSSKAFTDFDRTQVTQFNQEDLAQYARDHSISVEEANQKLQNLYGNQLTDNLDTRLRSQGFTKGANDIHYSTYNGIGAGSGPGDSYGAGFTGMRQKLQGVGTQYSTDAAGNIESVRKITGTAVVDQHGLNVAQVTGELPPNPDKFSPDEFKLFSQQQVQAANGHLDVKSVAKAMNRESDLANRITKMSGNDAYGSQLAKAGIPTDAPALDPQLTAIAKKIADNPSQADSILASKNLTPIQFQQQVSAAITSYHQRIGGAV
jgi:hypothetical protein